MTNNELSIINRFLGVVEGVAYALPDGAQGMVLDFLEVVTAILDKEDAKDGFGGE